MRSNAGGSNRPHLRFDKHAAEIGVGCMKAWVRIKENFIVFGRCSALSNRLMVRPRFANRWFWDFGLVSALRRKGMPRAYPRRIIQRPAEMTGRAVPAASRWKA
ncbi:MAG TPA: hypothetical protein VH397_16515 [Xanthobacteraceae bacterium]|jgi:hypothetical protein